MGLLMLIAGFALLFFSGDALVKSSVQIARYMKVSTLVIGVTVVAFGTSAPELLVSLRALLSGSPDISVGNVVGSNITNIALVLGLVSIVLPIKVKNKKLWIDWAVMMLASVLFFVFSYNGVLERWEGILFFVLLIAYLFWTIYNSRYTAKNQAHNIEKPTMVFKKAIALMLLASAGLYVGSELLVKGAVDIATELHLSERVIGISIVALGTSIPELATSLIAALKNETDISIGNIIGSNIFNILGVLGITSTMKPLMVSQHMIDSDAKVMMAVSLLLLLLILPLKKGILKRWKGAILVSVYIIYMLMLFI